MAIKPSALFITLLVHRMTLTLSVKTCTSPTIPSSLCECVIQDGNRRFLDCKDRNLRHIPTFAPSNDIFDEIDFSYNVVKIQASNEITAIPAKAFENVNVRKINLLTNPIVSVDMYAFFSNKSEQYLQTLFIEGNAINAPPTSPISVLSNLKHLHLKHYATNILERGDFPYPVLEKLTLERFINTSGIETFAFSPLQNLKSLTLDTLPAMLSLPVQEFLHLRSLETLVLKRLPLATIYPSTFDSFVNLKELYISYMDSQFTISDGAFGHSSTSLKNLDLRWNNLRNVHFLSAERFPNLTHLDLSANYELNKGLTNSSFATLSELRSLGLQDIGITEVQQSMFTGLSRLRNLDLSYNSIGTIGSSAFHLMPELTEFKLLYSPSVVSFQLDSFRGVNALQYLVLDGSLLDYAHFWSVIETLDNLVELNLGGTGLTAIRDYAFRHNTKLNTLVLDDNKISSINEKTFFGPRYTLLTLDLSSNNIHSVDACVFKDFTPTPSKLFFTNNPLRCDCGLTWLYDWVSAHGRQRDAALYYVGSCASPPNLAGKYMAIDFNKTDMCPHIQNNVQCLDLYSTTTATATPTRTISSLVTTATVASTKLRTPTPNFVFSVNQTGQNYIELIWHVQDKTHITGYQVSMLSDILPEVIKKNVPKEESSFRFYDLMPEHFFYFCLDLEIDGVLRSEDPKCVSAQTLPSSPGIVG